MKPRGERGQWIVGWDKGVPCDGATIPLKCGHGALKCESLTGRRVLLATASLRIHSLPYSGKLRGNGGQHAQRSGSPSHLEQGRLLTEALPRQWPACTRQSPIEQQKQMSELGKELVQLLSMIGYYSCVEIAITRNTSPLMRRS